MPSVHASSKTSPKSTPQTPPRALAQDGLPKFTKPRYRSGSESTALSSASTADGEASPEIPPIQAPRLSERIQGLLRTPPGSTVEEAVDQGLEYGASNWGSPYPPNLRSQSTSSDSDEDSEDSPLPLHRLQLDTPFLRPIPLVEEPQPERRPSVISAAAAVLANRARRIAHGITEDWIRSHTVGGSDDQEKRHWFSDGTGDSENSSLSGSFSGEEADWGIEGIQTPRAAKRETERHLEAIWGDQRKQSSNETLRQAYLERNKETAVSNMASSDERATPVSASDQASTTDSFRLAHEPSSITERPGTPKSNGQTNGLPGIPQAESNAPTTPSRVITKRPSLNATPHLKKRLPWKGKSIMLLLPTTDDRGQPGGRPMPLTQSQVDGMVRSWQQLGYTIDGFDLSNDVERDSPSTQSQSRGSWPDFGDITEERQQKNWTVLLPDLNAWKRYVDEVNEAKLRALGVSFGDEEPMAPPPPALSPATSMSRQASLPYPPLPFSPPIPTSSASSNQATPGFPFGVPFGLSGVPSPGIPAGMSPVSFGGKHNPRASIAIPSPHGWSPQLMLHGHRVGSPSLANLSSMMSPTSPFTPDGMSSPMGHQRHQSLQFPVLPHQYQPVRASPRLQDLCEVEEEEPSEMPQQHPEPGFVRGHNASDSLQQEIDEAEYHLEEQMRSQLDNDEDYSPHNENDMLNVDVADPSVQFVPKPHLANDPSGLVLHHPRPHSRGHSLSQKYYTEEDVNVQGGFRPTLQGINAHSEDSEIETNPSNLGTPVQGFDFTKLMHHQRSYSTASNPWIENEPARPLNEIPHQSHQSRVSHGSKSSFSKLNVEAPEFKFNPTNTFVPGGGGFAFLGNSSQAQPVFNAGIPPMNPHAFSVPPPAGPSKINVNAPVFAPSQTDFSFSSSGPKFRPDAPAFTPGSVPGSVSGNERASNKAGSIFGSIDLSDSDLANLNKQSKAVPVVRPESGASNGKGGREAPGDYSPDESRNKRARASQEDDSDVPQFAVSPEDGTPVAEVRKEDHTEDETLPMEEKSFDESNIGHEDALSSMVISATPDTEAAVSPSSPKQEALNWTPFEFVDAAEMQAFSEARGFRTDTFVHGHKKSLSATAKAFVPGGSVWNDTEATTSTIDQPTVAAAQDDQVAPVEKEVVVPSIEKVEEIRISTSSSTERDLPAAPKGLAASRYARVASPPPPPKQAGLSASRFATSISSIQEEKPLEVQEIPSAVEPAANHQTSPPPEESASPTLRDEHTNTALREPSMDDIDLIMRHLNENPNMGVKKTYGNQQQWHQPLAPVTGSSDLHLPPHGNLRSASVSPIHSHHSDAAAGYSRPVSSAELDDPFVDPPQEIEGAIQRLNGSDSVPNSNWDREFSEDEQSKLETRANFFNGHVNELVGGLLANRLGPLEESLAVIRNALAGKGLRLDRRSMSVDACESDADDEDDEDDEPTFRRSMSPRRDRKMEQIRSAVFDAFAVHQRNQPKELAPVQNDNALVLNTLTEIREQFKQSFQANLQGDLKNIVEQAVERHVPAPAVDKDKQLSELQARIAALEERLQTQEVKLAEETTARRVAEDRAADANRELETAATKIEVEMMNKSALGQRISDLEDRVNHADHRVEEEAKGRRAAEDRLSEVQRLLNISSEEENRLREAVDEKEQKLKAVEAAHSKSSMRLALLEAGQANAHQSQSEAQNKINSLEADLREARKETQHWRSETDRIASIAQRRDKDLAHALDENKAMHKLIDTLGTQIQENERVRDNWRAKFLSLSEDMARASKEIAEENARRTKREQALLARQEVLDARLQAEARTRERIETELERLEMGERQGMRAVAECKRLETALVELRAENNKLHQTAHRSQVEFQEARESGAREVQRTRDAMQMEIDNANHQVNVVREELEDQILRLRSQLDHVKMDADTARARHDMFFEEAQNSKKAELEELAIKHQNQIDDIQARYERQISNITEDAQRSEQNLLERLSISASKSEYLQDKVAHLEEKLEIAKEAARAAAQAAKSSTVGQEAVFQYATSTRELSVPEKISPQALRESIMVLQEQLQEREQRIEELEQRLSKADPDAETKISKRDDEIMWLRELLAVRHSDLDDIITAVGRDDYDKNAVKDAAIRLKANLQMEEQERERAMNGGSAITLPNIAATIQAATPRVAQAVGPLAAAWGNWRKGRDLGSSLASPSPANNSTPSKSSPSTSSFLGGLLTPPASGVRQITPVAGAQAQQPTAFSSTGRRFTPQDLANRPRGPSSTSIHGVVAPIASTPPRRALAVSEPVTPPMMRPTTYDSDAQIEDFDDDGFFDEN
ncbi:hypothetical protein QBC38DRAFT_508536 [Podospora fimiseda]|uniref:Myosin class II heavy chain n=1 Tax=Podospora fimiseda TaxID=252190 RepID=A0AAN7BT14_9PEZI|nr:hypothetical protein QBC38DRAFT_508536 [Podospora fimiseda]